MANFDDHPTVVKARSGVVGAGAGPGPAPPDEATLRALCLGAGADDVGFVAIDREELAEERPDIERLFPATRTLICFVRRMNPDAVRSPARSIANHEFHGAGGEVDDVARRIVAGLAAAGVRAVGMPMAFPMEAERFSGKMWSISLKPLAVAAGLGQMGIHRNLIHPRFGNFVLIGAVLADLDVDGRSRPIDYNPCLGCLLCVAACPVGAISPAGEFNFSSCYAHNYREFMSGFTDWVEAVADSRDAADYRSRVEDWESVSVWQSLTYGANYKAAYCMSVCPAGDDVIGPFLEDRGRFVSAVVRPLQRKEETLYVQPHSDAEAHARRRFPHKRVKRVGAVLRPPSIAAFIRLMRHAFQPGRSEGLAATYHFRFTGEQPAECTVTIRDRAIEVRDGLHGRCDLRVTADSRGWLRLLRKETGVVRLLITLRLRLRGDPRLMVAFGRCFP